MLEERQTVKLPCGTGYKCETQVSVVRRIAGEPSPKSHEDVN
jgi:hypothetical protein